MEFLLHSFPFCILNRRQTVVSVRHIWDVIAFLMIFDMLGQFLPFQYEVSRMTGQHTFWTHQTLEILDYQMTVHLHLCQLIVRNAMILYNTQDQLLFSLSPLMKLFWRKIRCLCATL